MSVHKKQKDTFQDKQESMAFPPRDWRKGPWGYRKNWVAMTTQGTLMEH